VIEPTDCNWCQARLDEFALDELAAGDRAQVAAHLESGCAQCNEQLAELVETFAALSRSLPQIELPARIERELMSRIAATRSELPVIDRAAPPPRSRKWLAAAAGLAASVAAAAYWINRTPPQPSFVVGWAELEQRIRAAQQAQQLILGPQLRFVSRGDDLAPDTDVAGVVVEDRLAHQCHVYVHNLPPLASDQEYRLWFVVADNSYLPAGSVQLDADGNASALLELPEADVGTIAVAISAESKSVPRVEAPTE
jgi:hypothetical protein